MKWALGLLFATLPLQWFLLSGLPLGPQRLHLVAMLLFAAAVFGRHRARAFLPVLSVALPFVVANVALVAIWSATALYNADPLRGPLQEALQLGVFVAVGTVVYRGARDPTSGVLDFARWGAAVAASSVVVALSLSMAINGVDPASVFAQTVAKADPAILQRELFRSAFAGFGYSSEEVQGNIRHEVFGAVLTAMYLSAASVRLRPLRSSTAKLVWRASMVVGVVLILLSLSRSVILAAAVWPVLAALRPLLRAEVSTRQLALSASAVAVVALASVTGFASVLWVRFTQDTGSYEARDELVQDALASIPDHLLTGGVSTTSASSHTLVLDSLLRAGVFGGLAALVITVLVVGLWLILIVRLRVEPSWMLPVTASLALPVVRLFTAGGGSIPPVEWVGLGILAGFLAFRAAGGPGPAHSARTGQTGARPQGVT